MFHVRRRPADSQPRRRKKKPLGSSNGSNSVSGDREGPTLLEILHSGDGGRRMKLGSEPIEVIHFIYFLFFWGNALNYFFYYNLIQIYITIKCNDWSIVRMSYVS